MSSCLGLVVGTGDNGGRWWTSGGLSGRRAGDARDNGPTTELRHELRVQMLPSIDPSAASTLTELASAGTIARCQQTLLGFGNRVACVSSRGVARAGCFDDQRHTQVRSANEQGDLTRPRRGPEGARSYERMDGAVLRTW